jgi:uncharacterized protein with ParB-like and HNH nuclease domain
MPYQEETIKTITDRLNTQYFLPSIQRNYVWKPQQVIMLFDSIMRGYPISSFLFWELTEDNRDKWEVYEFCKVAYSTGTSHTKYPSAVGLQNVTLVLDGQQRLTSILIGLKGIFAIRNARQWYNPQSYPQKRLYLDLFSNPDLGDEDNEFTGKPYYAFEWYENPPKNDQIHHWFQVGRVLDCRNDSGFYELKDSEEATFSENISKSQENIFERNLWRLYQAIYKDAAISYYVERDQDYDRVLDIFVRANEGGTELTKPEIILSMLESKWEKGAKNKIENFINEINDQSLKKNSINLEFIMRTCLVLANLPVRYRINTFTTKNIELIENMWPEIQNATKRTMTLVNRFGLDRSNITGLNVLIPLVQYFYQNPEKSFLGTTEFDFQNANQMRRWLILAMLNRVFGRGAEQILANLRHILVECKPGDDFPVINLNSELNRMRFPTELDDKSIRSYLDSEYPVEFLKLSLLYDDHFWDVVDVQQDHIFPKSLFDTSYPPFSALPLEKQVKFKSLVNKAANLQPLMDKENLEKRAQSFSEWILTRDKKFREIHLIPDNDELLKFERFDDFITARESLITEKLKKVI